MGNDVAVENIRQGTVEYEQDQVRDALALLLPYECLYAFFGDQTKHGELEMFLLHLRYLFFSGEALYQHVLHDISTWMTQQQALLSSTEDTICQYHLWNNLYRLQQGLERLSALAQLIRNVAAGLLGMVAYQQNTQATICTKKDEWLYSISRAQCEQARTITSKHIKDWHRSHSTHLPFTTHFASLVKDIPSIAQMDQALTRILDTMNTLFSETLPTLWQSTEQNELTLSLFLLELLQKLDLFLEDIGLVQDPLFPLIKQFTPLWNYEPGR